MTPSNELVQQMRAANHLRKIADASTRADGTDIPLGAQCRTGAEAILALIAALEAMTRERDALLMQAQIWAGEAKCHKSTVHEAYQIVTGAKGEPGNWHGAEPIKAALEATNARADAAEAKAKRYEDLMFWAEHRLVEVELDPDNYSHADVAGLNDRSIEVGLALSSALPSVVELVDRAALASEASS